MKKLVFIFWVSLGLVSLNAFADEAADNMVKNCQKYCKKAKTPEKIHKCIEKKGRLNKAFRKTKC